MQQETTLTAAQRWEFIAKATPLERAAMLHYLGGFTPEGFSNAVRMVEHDRELDTA